MTEAQLRDLLVERSASLYQRLFSVGSAGNCRAIRDSAPAQFISSRVGGHLTALRRTAVGPFTLDGAVTDLDQVTVTPLADAARATFPAIDLDADQAQAVRYGRPLPLGIHTLTGVFAPDGEFLALYRPEGGAARPAAVFVG